MTAEFEGLARRGAREATMHEKVTQRERMGYRTRTDVGTTAP